MILALRLRVLIFFRPLCRAHPMYAPVSIVRGSVFLFLSNRLMWIDTKDKPYRLKTNGEL